LIFTRRGVDIKKYPAIERYLRQFKKQLMPKPKNWEKEKWQGRKPGGYQWYEIQDTTAYYQEFEKTKIIYPNICQRPEFSFDKAGYYANAKCFIIPIVDKYLLGILNSSVTFFLFRFILPKLRGDFYEPRYVYLKNFPIRLIDFNNPTDKANHDKMVQLVERMLKLNQKLATAKEPQMKNILKRRIEATDREIDQLVYRLYDLTASEIKLVEKG